MSIQYPTAGAIFYTQFTPTSVPNICNSISSALASCGWQISNLKSAFLATFTGLPANGQTFVLGVTGGPSTSYMFVTTLNNTVANQVLIGLTAAACATNLYEAINGGPNSGVDYSTPTVASTIATATLNGTVVSITAIASAFSGNSQLTISNGLNNVSISGVNGSNAMGNGYLCTMPATPQGLIASVIIDQPGTTDHARIRICTPDFNGVTATVLSAAYNADETAGAYYIKVAAGRTLEFAGCAHQFFIFLLGDTGTDGTRFSMGVPYIDAPEAPLLITGASNASPIVITTGAAHGLTTGQDVFISDVQGNTAANSFWTVTVLSSTTFSLNGSSGNGAYTGSPGTYYSGGVVAPPGAISRCIWALGNTEGNGNADFRVALWTGGGTNNFVCTNQYFFAAESVSSPFGQCIGMIIPQKAQGVTQSTPVFRFGVTADILEPRLCWGLSNSSGTTPYIIGQLWAALLVTEAQAEDRQQTGFNGHNWFNLTANWSGGASLWIAKS